MSPKVVASTVAGGLSAVAAYYAKWPIGLELSMVPVFAFALGWLVPDPARGG